MADINKAINEVTQLLKTRVVHPSGTFGKGKKFYASNSDLINVRSPSHRWPFSELNACRTRIYVTKVADKFNCKTVKTLLKHI